MSFAFSKKKRSREREEIKIRVLCGCLFSFLAPLPLSLHLARASAKSEPEVDNTKKKGEGGYREQHQLPSLQWLVLHGALCRPGSGANEGDDGAAASEHTTATDPRIVKRDLRKGIVRVDKDLRATTDFRGSLLVWARGIVSASRSFRFAFLPGTLSTPTRRGSAHLWMLNEQGVLELIAAFVGGVERGRRLRNAREFEQAMLSVIIKNPFVEGPEEVD